jgi:hypothetical protein
LPESGLCSATGAADETAEEELWESSEEGGSVTERDFWTWLCSLEQEEIFQVAKDALAYGCQQNGLDPNAVALEIAASILDDPRQLPEAHVFERTAGMVKP